MFCIRRVGPLFRALDAMKLISKLFVLFCLLISFGAFSEESKVDISQAIANSSSISLLSLEPGEKGTRNDDGECIGFCYFGVPVLGQSQLSQSASNFIRKNLTSWVAAPMPEAIELCFSPRHGVRVISNGDTYDFVVCFECSQTRVYKDSAEEPIAYLYYKGSQQDWDKILSAANIPLASKVTEDGI